MRIAIISILALSCVSAAQTAKRITGKYTSSAFGYEITIPEGLVGIPAESVPEKGFDISLASGGTLSVFAEANPLGWRSPMDGIRHSLGVEKCDSTRQQATSFMRMGRPLATKGTLVCGDRVVEMLLTFHSGSTPVYWITLRTTVQKRNEDEAVFNKLAATFQLIPTANQ